MLFPPPRHLPVLTGKVMEFLAPDPGQTIVDCTIGAGGHALRISELLGPTGHLVGIDQDEEMLALAGARGFACPYRLVHANFDQLREVLNQLGIDLVDGVYADLGVCSDQLDDAHRGFSFQQPGPLDMRLDKTAGHPASKLLERLGERDLVDLIWKYGEERFSRRIARQIVQQRQRTPLRTTHELADLVRRCVPRTRGIDPATRTFQALRIAVNDELGALQRLLLALTTCLKAGGRAVVISFHSLEDRLVKRCFNNRKIWQRLTAKPVRAGTEEILTNPRASSAKLRAAMRL